MNENNTARSAANLGVFVVMAIVPIVVYVMGVLVLPWVGRGFHQATAPDATTATASAIRMTNAARTAAETVRKDSGMSRSFLHLR